MLFLISPAKSLDYDTPLGPVPHTRPLFPEQTGELIEVLRKKSPQQIAEMMDLSDSLAAMETACQSGIAQLADEKAHAKSLQVGTPQPAGRTLMDDLNDLDDLLNSEI